MAILSALRDRLSARTAPAQWKSAGDGHGDPGVEARLPFAGYDRLDERQVIEGLSDRSQIELGAVESYERSHKDREPVLDKLRYMRQREPLAGYDALSAEEIATALNEADLATIKKVRGYERKFANRRDVLEAVARAHQRRQATQPASAAPAYQPISATSVARGRDRTEKDGSVMTDPAAARLPPGLPAELTKALVSLWTRYAGKRPTNARTEIRANVVTCVLVDAVADYNRSMIAPQTRDAVAGVGKQTAAAYKREAIAAVTRLTRQRVASFVSSHDRDTDVATEVFTLEPFLSRGAPRAATNQGAGGAHRIPRDSPRGIAGLGPTTRRSVAQRTSSRSAHDATGVANAEAEHDEEAAAAAYSTSRILPAMSQENVEIVRRMWEGFLGDDPVTGLSFCDPDIEWDGTNLPDGKVARGHEAIVEHATRWAEMWDDWRVEPEQFIDAGGDQVILVFREIGRSESGLQLDERHAELYRLRDGKVVYRKGFSDPDEAFAAAGLSE